MVIDGGNSYYHDDISRAAELKPKGIQYVDVGTSGGVWAGARLLPDDRRRSRQSCSISIRSSSPSPPASKRRRDARGRTKLGGTAEHGYLHCGASGAGHFVKMVHNGIEYGIMSAYAEGLNILRHANAGKQQHDRRCRDRPAAPSRALSVRSEPCRHRRSLASRERHRVLASGPGRHCAAG